MEAKKAKNWFRYLSLEKKVLLPIVVLQGLLIGTFIFFSFNLRWHENIFNENTTKIEEINKLSARLYDLRKRMDANVLTYRFEKDEDIVGLIKQDQEESEIIIEKLGDMGNSETGQRLIENYLNMQSGAETMRNDLIAAIRNGDSNKISQAYQRWSIKTDSIDAALADLTNYNSKNIGRLANLHQGVLGSVYQIIILTILSTIFLIITLYYYLRRTVTKPVLELSKAANKISAGRLNIKMKVESNDEIGLLAKDLEKMEEQLKEYYKGLKREVKLKEEELRITRELDKRKDDFISIASHELKTPITSMKIFAELLKRRADMSRDEKSVAYLNRIDDQIDRLINLVSQLLDVSKIEAGGLKLNKSIFRLDDLVKETIDELEENIPNHKVITNLQRRLRVRADRDRVQQVLINLLTNAAKYSPDADKIVVKGKVNKNNEVIISVKDYGMGIPRKHQGKIFEKFFRVYEGRDRTFPGLGMGLHIAWDIIKKHKGKIWFESEPDKGSTFYFSLPLIIKRERRTWNDKKGASN